MKKRYIILSVLLVLFIAIAAAPFVLGDLETKEMNDAARAAFKDETFINLSDGVAHYTWQGKETDPVVVMVHGFSTPSWVWERQAPALVEAGHRVLTYDLYGRGHSDRPYVDYNADLYDRQLVELLDALGVKQPIDIVGLSMGGAITVGFVDRHPERVKRFALIAPAGLGAGIPAAARLLQVPGLGAWAMKAFGDRILFGQMNKLVEAHPDLLPMVKSRYEEQMCYRGYKYALRSSLLHMSMAGMDEAYQRVGAMKLPSALFWGTADSVVPYALHEKAVAAMPGISFHSIEGAGHAVNFEEPEKVNPGLLALLSDSPVQRAEQ